MRLPIICSLSAVGGSFITSDHIYNFLWTICGGIGVFVTTHLLTLLWKKLVK